MIRVGILHSLSGTMAISEMPLVEAALMAINEINATGGVLGEQIETSIEDGASHPQVFVQKAKKLIHQDGINNVFGCWTSFSRKAVKPLFEQHNALLWYPVQYEGLEQSKNIFYTGSCLNQQIEPAVTWLLQNHYHSFLLLGSNYVFPKTANQAIKGQLKNQGGMVVGEEYVRMGEQNFAEQISLIATVQPDIVFNTLNGDSNIAFYDQYAAAGITADQIPIMGVSIAEAELQRMNSSALGHYACWNYFQSLNTPDNHKFVQNFQHRYGTDRVTSDPIENAYTQVYLWRQAVESAQSFDVDRIRVAAYGQTFAAPSGQVKIEANHHVWKGHKIGRVLPNQQFEVIFSSDQMIKPLPWLGVEEIDFDNTKVVIELLGEVSQGIQYSWQLEQNSLELQAAMAQLKVEIAERNRSQSALAKANEEILLLNQRLKAENLRMSAELEVAHKIQQMILPKELELSQISELEIAGLMEPSSEVGGDYYDVMVQDGRIKIGIGDVTGHGLESSVLMIMVQTAIRTLLACQEIDPVKFLITLNQTIYSNVQRMKSHKNLSLALLDYQAGKLTVSGQHEEIIIVRADGKLERIDTLDLGFPIGLESDITDFVSQVQVHLYAGDVVVLYTDGITEAEDMTRKQYGLERLSNVICGNHDRSSIEIREAVITDLRSYIGEQRVYDDITLVVMKQR